jgi:hypothetical protein
MGFDSSSEYLHNANSNGTTSDIFVAKFGPVAADIRPVTTAGQLSVYPNPSTGQLNVVGLPMHSVIQVFDITGRLLLNTETASENTVLNLSSYPAGVYILNTPLGTRKIVKI